MRINLVLDANPLPGDFTWTQNGRIIAFGMPGTDLGVDFIMLDMVTRFDSGTYMIVANNVAGSGNASFSLSILGKVLQ